MNDTKTYELADFGDRFGALIVDIIIISIVGSIFGINTSLFGGGIFSIAIGAAYQWYFLTQHNGQTPGKMLLKIRVVKTDGTALNEVDALMRYVGYVINALPFLIGIGWLWAAFDSKSQGWHDKIANTYVVKARQPKAKNNTVMVDAFNGKAKRKNDTIKLV
jgi:uncharacterized RDD family membrane protein YckC